MRERSKSCFITSEELQKQSQEDATKEITDSEFDKEIVAEILNQIQSQIPLDDDLPYDERLAKIKWKKINYDGWSHKKNKDLILDLVEKTRKHRILTEILCDISVKFLNKEVNFNKKYVLDKLHLDVRKKNIEKKLEKTPFTEFYDSLKPRGVKYMEARKMYKEMDEQEKIQLILKFLDVNYGEKLNLSQYNKAKLVLNSQEMALIDAYEQKPKKLSLFNQFMQNYIKKIKNSGTELDHGTIFKQAAQAWKNLSEAELQKYKNEFGAIQDEYQKKLKKFLDSLPEDRIQNLEMPNKKKKNDSSKSEQSIASDKDSVLKSKLSPKKRKLLNQQENSSQEKGKDDLLSKRQKLNKKSSISEFQNTSDTSYIKIENEKKIDKYKKNQDIWIDDSTENNNESKNNLDNHVKKSKKAKKEKIKEPKQQSDTFELKKPPQSLFKFYVLSIHKGPISTAKATYKALSKEEKKNICKKHEKVQTVFLRKFTQYLNNLSVEDMENFQTENHIKEESISGVSDLSSDSFESNDED